MVSKIRTCHSTHFASLREDSRGIALIYITIALPVIIGFSLLGVDVGRLWSLQSSLQHAADALALAGAAELDRRNDAIIRADRAIDSLVQNPTIFADTVASINGSSIDRRYLTALPATDDLAITANITTTGSEARFVEVTLRPVNFTTIFPASFFGGSNTTQARATAVAGFDAAVCNFTPMFMCNPFEPVGNTDVMRSSDIFEHISTEASRRRLIEFKRIGPSGQWSPGNYGFLEAQLGPGANALGESIAGVSPHACFIQNGVYTKPGNTAVAAHAFNVRFDIYHGSYNRNNSDYRPATNVRKGYVPSGGGGGGAACDTQPATDLTQAMGFPRDSCFANSSCSFNNRIGNGDWDFDAYWATNFNSMSKPAGYSNTNEPSRYFVYRYEIDHNLVGNWSAGGSTNGERGTPQCYSGSTPASDAPDRRILYGAMMNCIAQPISSGSAGGPYTAVAFAKFFITEPMNGPQDSLWVELIDVVEPGSSSSVARDLVQLYR
jgi:Flp pilus assembly protein TadG